MVHSYAVPLVVIALGILQADIVGAAEPDQRDASPELRWRDPVPEYTPDLLCTGDCMVPWENNTVVYEKAEPLPRKKQPPPLLDWLRDLFKRERGAR